MRPGRLTLLAAAAAYVVVLARSALVLPAQVPAHFGAGGQVQEWASRSSILVFWVVVGVVVLLGIPLLVRLTVSGDGTWVNMPQRSKEYWFAPERRAEFRVRFCDDMEVFASLTGVLVAAGLGVTTWVATTGRDGAPWWLFTLGIGGYMALTALWTIRLLVRYRPPTPPRGRT